MPELMGNRPASRKIRCESVVASPARPRILFTRIDPTTVPLASAGPPPVDVRTHSRHACPRNESPVVPFPIAKKKYFGSPFNGADVFVERMKLIFSPNPFYSGLNPSTHRRIAEIVLNHRVQNPPAIGHSAKTL